MAGALIVGGLSYYSVITKTKAEKADLQSQIDNLTAEKNSETSSTDDNDTSTSATDSKNVVKYANSKSNIDLQFELPDNYGAALDEQGEGLYLARINVGKLLTANGDNVIQTTTSLPTYVRIIPSYDSKISTLADWRKAEGLSLDPGSDATKMSSVTVAGITAERFDVGGFGEFHLIQFVKDKHFFEIRNEVGRDEDAITKILSTFHFN